MAEALDTASLTDLPALRPPPGRAGGGRWAGVAKVLFWAAVGALIGVGIAMLAPGRLAMGGGQLAGMVLSLLAHELGHVAAGTLAGFRFIVLGLGPLKVQREGDRIAVRRERRAVFWGGYAGMAVAPENRSRLRWRLLAFAAGGPAASVLLAAAAGAAWRGAAGGAAAPALLQGLGLGSAAVALATLLPLPAGPDMTTDGTKIQRLLRGGRRARALCDEFAMYSAAALGVRPRDWPAADAAGVPVGCASHLLCYYRAADQDRRADAARHLQQAMLAAGAKLPPHLLAEAAYYEAAWRGDAAAARRWLRSFPPALGRAHQAEAAIAVAEGDAAQALAAIHAARAELAPMPGGATAFERERLQELERAVG